MLLFLEVLFGALGNTLFDKGMKQIGALGFASGPEIWAGALRTFTNGTIWMGVLCMLLFIVCHMLVLSWADFSFVMPFSAVAYALVPLFAYLWFGEKVLPVSLGGDRTDCGWSVPGQPHAAEHHAALAATIRERIAADMRTALISLFVVTDGHRRRNRPHPCDEAHRRGAAIFAGGDSSLCRARHAARLDVVRHRACWRSRSTVF